MGSLLSEIAQCDASKPDCLDLFAHSKADKEGFRNISTILYFREMCVICLSNLGGSQLTPFLPSVRPFARTSQVKRKAILLHSTPVAGAVDSLRTVNS